MTKRRDKRAAFKFLMKAMKRYGQPSLYVSDSTVLLNLDRSKSGVQGVAGEPGSGFVLGHKLGAFVGGDDVVDVLENPATTRKN